jgi:hypothetical protein
LNGRRIYDTHVEFALVKFHIQATGNKAFAARLTLFKSKLTSKTAKLRLYQMVIRPTVTYACETWTLKEATKHRLLVFERKAAAAAVAAAAVAAAAVVVVVIVVVVVVVVVPHSDLHLL